MKNLTLLIATFYSLMGFSQSANVDSIRFEGSLPVVSSLYKDCGVKDTNALILILKASSHWSYGQHNDYVVFYPNGKVEVIEEFIPIDAAKKREWKKRKVKGDIKLKFWTFLDSCISNDLLILNQKGLKNNSMPSKEEGKRMLVVVYDGPFYSFALFKGREYLNNSCYSPESYISEEFKGKEEKVKFLAVIEGFEKLINAGRKKG